MLSVTVNADGRRCLATECGDCEAVNQVLTIEREFKDEIPEQIPDLNSERICLDIFLWMIHKLELRHFIQKKYLEV